MDKISACILCGETKFVKLFDTRTFALGSKNMFSVVRCESCGLVLTDPAPTGKEMADYYPNAYYDQPQDPVRDKTPMFLRQDKVAIVKVFRKQGAVLDVGCAAGFFLERMQKQGWQVHGFDFSPDACRLLEAKIGRDHVFCGDILKSGLKEDFYDVITLWQVIEHLHQPLEALKKLRKTLKNDGILIIACPNFKSWFRRIFKSRWYPLQIPTHLYQWTPETLTTLLEKAGFRIIKIKTRFIDLLGDMGSFKMSLLRSIGLARLTQEPYRMNEAEKCGCAPQRNLWWITARAMFNIFCSVVTLLCACCGNQEQILVWAKKTESDSWDR